MDQVLPTYIDWHVTLVDTNTERLQIMARRTCLFRRCYSDGQPRSHGRWEQRPEFARFGHFNQI